jgi:hypothetical protein
MGSCADGAGAGWQVRNFSRYKDGACARFDANSFWDFTLELRRLSALPVSRAPLLLIFFYRSLTIAGSGQHLVEGSFLAQILQQRIVQQR